MKKRICMCPKGGRRRERRGRRRKEGERREGERREGERREEGGRGRGGREGERRGERGGGRSEEEYSESWNGMMHTHSVVRGVTVQVSDLHVRPPSRLPPCSIVLPK